jgi:hypothetical protein
MKIFLNKKFHYFYFLGGAFIFLLLLSYFDLVAHEYYNLALLEMMRETIRHAVLENIIVEPIKKLALEEI